MFIDAGVIESTVPPALISFVLLKEVLCKESCSIWCLESAEGCHSAAIWLPIRGFLKYLLHFRVWDFPLYFASIGFVWVVLLPIQQQTAFFT
jgi:hypothetical protein